MRHIPEGGDFFDGQNKQMHGDFGFSGSIKQREVGGHPPFGQYGDNRWLNLRSENGHTRHLQT